MPYTDVIDEESKSMKSKTHIFFGVMAVFALILGANLNNYAIAENQKEKSSGGGIGLTVVPSIDKLGDVKPGEVYDREIIVTNPTDKEVEFKFQTSSFWIEGDEYELKWGVSESQYGKIAKWTNIDQTKVHKLQAGETFKLEYDISVPKNQAGGSQHLMVSVSLGSSGDSGFVSTEMRLNTLIYANVEGEVKLGAEIISRDIQGFSFTPNIRTDSVIKNTGNVDLDVHYKMYASSFFSGEQAFVDETEKTLVVDSTRMFEQSWTDAPRLGIFNVTQEITYLGETHTIKSVVVICPMWLIIACVFAIVLLIVYIIYRYNFKKKHRKN